jgi:hypothetical protein
LDVPLGRVVELIARGAAAATIERATVAVAVWAGEPASWTEISKVKFPLAVGVPKITPVDVFRLRPGGGVPEEIDHMYGEVPPLACKARE